MFSSSTKNSFFETLLEGEKTFGLPDGDYPVIKAQEYFWKNGAGSEGCVTEGGGDIQQELVLHEPCN